MDFNRDALDEQVLATHIVAARTAAARVEAFLATRGELAAGAAADPAYADPRSPAAQEALRGDLAAWAGLGVLGLAVVDERGEEAIRAQLRDDEAKRRTAAALRSPSREPVLALPGDGAAPATVRLEVPLSAGGGRLRLVCDGGPLAEAVSPGELGEGAELVLAGRDGMVLVGEANALAGFPRAMVAQATSGKLGGANRYDGGDGQRVLGAYSPVRGSGWVVLSRQPGVVADAVARRMWRRSLLAVAAALLLILLLSAAAWVTVVRPIRELARAQGELVRAQGVLQGGGPGTVALEEAGGDEIGSLRRSFEALQRSLADRESLEGVSLGRYRVLEYLGTGAMGTVFRGLDPRLRRPVALKTVRLGEHLDAERRHQLLETLLHEAVTVASLSHPNVVAVYDLEDAPEGAFVAMELVEGENLDELLWRRGRLSAGQVIPLGAAIARGLAAAHARDIVHRDVKPANILLGRDGSIKVSDFGIADLVARTAQKGDRVFGTPGYMPPESLRGGGHGKSGDLFAMGVILYECLSGTRPFDGANVAEVARETLFGEVRPLERQVSGLPPALVALVKSLLEKDPDLRPAGADVVAAELERMAAAEGLRWDPAAERAVVAAPPVREIKASQWVPTVLIEPA
ncbi:MAG TPA: protein kinase [Thermoanaerobaculia bacterium]|nr:protein kinase [Thermoanaerobaculia bacterium]